MNALHQIHRFSSLVITGLALTVSSSVAFAGDTSVGSAAISPIVAGQLGDPNGSYLNNNKYREQTIDPFAGDATYADRKRAEYADRFRNYEMRNSYHLNSHYEERAHIEEIQSYQKSMLGELRKLHLDAETAKMRKNAEKDPSLNTWIKPMVFLAGVYAFYSGEKMTWSLTDSSRLSAQSKFENRSGSLEYFSQSINANVSVANQPAKENAAAVGETHAKKVDRMRAGLSRALGVFGLHSGVAYGAQSRALTASLSRQIIPYVTGVLDSTRSVGVLGYDAYREDAVKLLFGMNF